MKLLNERGQSFNGRGATKSNSTSKSSSLSTRFKVDAITGNTCVYFLNLHGKRLKLRQEFPRNLLK